LWTVRILFSKFVFSGIRDDHEVTGVFFNSSDHNMKS